MFQNVFQRFIFMFIVTELIYLSYARSMDNLCVLLYDCIFNWNTRTSRVWQLIRDITAEKSKSCTFNAIFRYTLTFLPARVCLLYTAHSNTHSVTYCFVPAFWTSRERSNCFRITWFSVLALRFSHLFACVLSISRGFQVFLGYLAELYSITLHRKESSSAGFRESVVVTIVH